MAPFPLFPPFRVLQSGVQSTAFALCIAATPALAQIHISDGDVDKPYLFDVVKTDPAVRTALTRLFKAEKGLPKWVTGIPAGGPYVASAPQAVTGSAGRFTLYNACKQHDCGDNQLYILVAPDGSQAWGLLDERGKVRFLGQPDAARREVLSAASR